MDRPQKWIQKVIHSIQHEPPVKFCSKHDRLLKKIMMTLGLKTDTAELNVEKLIKAIGSDLPAVVFSDEPVTKMHDSLPMALFRFQILLKLYEAQEFVRLAYFFPWVLINEGMSHTNVAVCDRVSWFLMAYRYLMTCLDTDETSELGPGMSLLEQKTGTNITRRTLFDQKLLVHATNSTTGILYEIRNDPVGMKISLQRILTVPVEKKFGVTRMHAGRHQTLSAIIKTMQIDEALKFVYANAHVKHRRLAYGEIVDACPDLFEMDYSPFVLAQAVLCVVGFPARMIFAVDCLGPPEDQIYDLVE